MVNILFFVRKRKHGVTDVLAGIVLDQGEVLDAGVYNFHWERDKTAR